jgi:hypothetical protein
MRPDCSLLSIFSLWPPMNLSLSHRTAAAAMTHTDTMTTARRPMGVERPTRMETAATPGELDLCCRIFLLLTLSFLCSCSCCEIWGILFGEQGILDVTRR